MNITYSIKPLVVWVNIGEKKIGLCLCHHLPDRSIPIFGIDKFLCARCLGILCGCLEGFVIYSIFRLDLLSSSVLLIPMLFDGFAQLITKYNSTNPIRLITGTLFGVGAISLISELFQISITDIFQSLNPIVIIIMIMFMIGLFLFIMSVITLIRLKVHSKRLLMNIDQNQHS